MKVVIFDDVLWRRQADYRLPGLELVFHEHADDAVDVVKREKPALVMMDYSMDDHLSGAEAVRALRAVWPVGQLTIVGISSDPDSNRRMLAVGADDALPKTHLRAYLSRVTASRRV